MAAYYRMQHQEHLSAHRYPLPLRYFIAVLLLVIVVFAGVIFVEKLLPTPLRIVDESVHPERFIAERAFDIVKKLTALGPRVAGSTENDQLARDLLRAEINEIVRGAHNVHTFQVDVQNASGAFNLRFLDGMTNVYSGVQNVAVKIGSKLSKSPSSGGPHSLLVNCHFDSVFDSPGGSDDGASCAVMLEILRVISKSPRRLRHNIVFLFNGAEENFLPASHGFITQHPWAKEVRSFVNMEACGAGGREVLFQAGPNHPWILEVYADNVPYPYASSLAQEIFQSGVIPADTDYRIFRDFGNVSGLDFAWSANGYVYHTKFDGIDQIPLGALQRTGDNILALIRGMVDSHQLANTEKYRAGNLVFFDFVGAFVVRWSMHTGDLLNMFTVILSIYSIHSNMKSSRKSDDLKPWRYCRILMGCVSSVLLSWLLIILFNTSIAFVLTALGRSMSWYVRPFWAFLLYAVPSLVLSMATLRAHSNLCTATVELSIWTRFQFYYDAYQLMGTVTLLAGTLLRIRSSFLALIWVVPATIGNLAKTQLFGHWRDVRKWLALHIGVMGLPFVQSFYLLIGALYLFLPLMGRSGAGSYAEYLVAVMVGVLFALQFAYVIPLAILVPKLDRFLGCLVGVFLLSLALIILTPLGFPYSGDARSLAPQRYMITHTKRTFHTLNGSVEEPPTYGYWIVDMDVNSPYSVYDHVTEVRHAHLIGHDQCEQRLYCGVPYLVPVLNLMHITHWLPAPQPPHLFDPELTVQETRFEVWQRRQLTAANGSLVRVGVAVKGDAHHVGVILSPQVGVSLQRWSILQELPLVGPTWRQRDTYFVFYAYGLQPAPLNFTMDFQIDAGKSIDEPLFDIAVISHYLFGAEKSSRQFTRFVRRFPSWTTVSFWTSTYESWII